MSDSANDTLDSTPPKKAMPFLDHLEELRWRLLKSIVAIIAMSMVAFYFSDHIFKFVIIPLGDIKLHFTEVTGSFYAYLKLSLIVGVVGALPIIFYQIWSFIGPGLYKHEKAMVLPLVGVSTLLFLLGAAFCYYVMLPISLAFLIGFSGEILSPIITVGSYISFAGLLALAFGFGFQLPVIGYFLAKIGILRPEFLVKTRRYALVTMLIVGAILTPPDVFTQVLLAAPLYILYEISIIVVRITANNRDRKARKLAAIEFPEDTDESD